MGNFIRFIFSKSFVINLVLALLLVAGLIFFALRFLESYTLHGETIEVPQYEGLIWEDTLGQANPNFELIIADSIYVLGAEKNLILEQAPLAGETVKRGRKIYLTLSSSNPPTISMPNLVDLSLRQATSLMQIYGLQIGELTYRPDQCTNCILEQLMDGEEIEEGVRVQKGVKIDLVVGGGLSKEKVEVPYILSFTVDEVNVFLKSKSLNIGSLNFDETVENADDSSRALVYRQVPQATDGAEIFMGSSIDLYLTLDTNRIVHSVNPSESD